MIRTYRYRLSPTRAQERTLLSWLTLTREVYNAALEEKKGAYEKCGLHVSLYDQTAQLAVDLVFTSPPYHDRERYSREETQSWRRHAGGLEAWVEGFLRPVCERAYRALPRGGHLVLNVADLREKKAVIPIVARTTEVAIASGFDHAETLRMPLAAVNRRAPSEPVLVFQKP